MSEPALTKGAAAARDLERVTADLLAAARPLSPELLVWRPASDVWSVMDILCHVEEFVPYWMREIAGMLAHPDQPWGRDHTHAERLAAVAETSGRRLSDVEDGIRAAVRRAAATLEALSDEDFAVEATSRNPRWGLKPVAFIVDRLLVQHVGKHVGQIARNVGQFQQRGQSAQ